MVEFLETAAAELEDGIAFYELRAEGLGERFLLEVRRAVAQIEEQPRSGSPIVDRRVPPGVRQLVLPTFPYSVVYSEPELVVIAVAHQKRRPRYWLKR